MTVVPKWAQRVWRWLEGLHTLAWLLPSAFLAALVGIGAWSGVQWFWVLVFAPISAAALLYVLSTVSANMGVVSLRQAARRVLVELEGSGSFWYDAATGHSSSLDGQLDYLGRALRRFIPIFGRRTPSIAHEEIPEQVLASHRVADGAQTVRFGTYGEPIYTDLHVRKRDLRVAIRRMRHEAASSKI